MNPVSRWLHKRRVEREIADEIAEHLAEKIDQLRDDGHSEEEARALARRQFGNTTLQQEDSRAAWGWNTVEQFWQDMRFGWRVLTKTPAFTATAVIVLALGIGMNTAMFSAVKAVLLSALPYPEPERIVELRQTAKDGHMMNVSGLDFRDWRAQSRTIEYMATYGNDSVTLSGSFPARRVRMAAVGNGFSMWWQRMRLLAERSVPASRNQAERSRLFSDTNWRKLRSAPRPAPLKRPCA